MKVCKEVGCRRPVKARGWCPGHYERWRTGMPIHVQLRAPNVTPGETCLVEDCEMAPDTRGWCNPHYQRWWKYGDPGHIPTGRVRGVCEIEDCERAHAARGWCRKHYEQWRKTGDPLVRREPVKCGTMRGARRHRNRGEDLCWPCRRAERRYHRERWRTRHNVSNPRIVEEKVTVRECALDLLDTYWPDGLRTDVLIARILDIHPEWDEKNIRRVLVRDVSPAVDLELVGGEAVYRSFGPTWEEAV